MQKPPKDGTYADRHIDCQAALEDDLNDLIDRAEAAGWEPREAAAAVIDLAAAYVLKLDATGATNRQIAEALARRAKHP